MGFLAKIRSAMGFDSSDDYYTEEEEGIDATVTPLRERRNIQSAAIVSESSKDQPVNNKPAAAPTEPDDSHEDRPDASAIFTRVVEIFNQSLPDFLKKSVDPVRQRQVLFDALDTQIKEYFEHYERNVERRVQSRFQTDRYKLQEQIDTLRDKAKATEEENSNARNLQLSAERQKRALSERVHDLEKQLATLEAENEQYILENKSMANKLRVASITEDGGDDMRRQLVEQSDALRQREKTLSERENSLSEREATLSERETSLSDRENSLTERESSFVGCENALNERETSLVEREKKLRERETVSMESSKLLENAESRLTEMKTELEASARRAREEAEKNVALSLKLTATEEQLSKAKESLKVVTEVQEQIKKLEEAQRQSDAGMRKLKDELLEKDEILKAKSSDLLTKNSTLRVKDETIRRLEDQTDSLRKSVENLQYEKSQVESTLRAEIARLKALRADRDAKADSLPSADAAVPTPSAAEAPVVYGTEDARAASAVESITPEHKPDDGAARKPGRKKPSKEIHVEKDDLEFDAIDATDWLIASPEHEANRKHRKQKAALPDDDFGYKEPPRQDPPDNPAQMLLW